MAAQPVDDSTYVLLGSELCSSTATLRAYLHWRQAPHKFSPLSRTVQEHIGIPQTGAESCSTALLTSREAQRNGAPRMLMEVGEVVRWVEKMHSKGGRHGVLPKDEGLAFLAGLVQVVVEGWVSIQGCYWMLSPEVLSQQKSWIAAELEDISPGDSPFPSSSQPSSSQLESLGITPSTSTAIRHQFHTLLSLLNTHFSRYRFLLGGRISIADFALYGPFAANLYRNPVPGYIMKTEAPKVAEWIERVAGMGRAGSAHGVVVTPVFKPAGEVGWVDEYPSEEDEDAQLPDTIIPVLELLLGDYIPHLTESCRQVYEFLDTHQNEKENPGARIALPHVFGWQEFFLRSGKPGLEARGRRRVDPRAVWMLQELVKEGYTGRQKKAEEMLARVVGLNMVYGAWGRCARYVGEGKWTLEMVNGGVVGRMVEEKAKL